MKTQVSELAENRVRLDVEVPADAVDHAFEHAITDLSAAVRVPGFRKGKAPRPLVMRQVGREAVVEEALRDHLTGWYSRAVAVAGIDPVARPTLDWNDEPVEGAPFSFTAEVEVKPVPVVKAHKGLEGVRIPVEVPADAVDAEIERLRLTVAELRTVERGAQPGDFLVIDYAGTIDGEPFDDSSASDYGVELGEGRLAPEIEQGLTGARPGDARDVDLHIPPDHEDERLRGKRVAFHVTVKDVKERALPPLDDDLATSVSEFDTLGELRADVHERIREALQRESDMRFRASVLDSLGAQLQTPVPDALVRNRVADLVRSLLQNLAARGVAVEDYLRATGMASEELAASVRPRAEDSVRKDLALEAVVAAEQIDVTDEQLEAWVAEQAAEASEPETADRLLGDPAARTALRQDLAAQRALDIVVEHAKEISPETADAREKLWTPGQESGPPGETPSPIWTPGSS
jgi:trigger factor